jgi:tetratricopeptide (TPR) repeat protein
VNGSLFDQYKAALRRGHLAALAGNLDEALDAYAAAARLVPDRALPVASQGTVLHRLDRWPEAAEAFERALQLAPDDEAALRARAVAREQRGLRSGAASDFERLAFVLDVAGRSIDAADAARRAANLEPSAVREALADRLARAAALRIDLLPSERAMPASRWGQVPDPRLGAIPIAEPTDGPRADSPAAEAAEAGEAAEAIELSAAMAPAGASDEPGAGESLDGPELGAARTGDHEPGDAEAGLEAPEPAAAGATDMTLYVPTLDEELDALGDRPDAISAALAARLAELGTQPAWVDMEDSPIKSALGDLGPDGQSWPPVDLPSPPPPPLVGPPPDPEDLLADAATLIAAGDVRAARDLMLTAAMVHRAAGRLDAALEICLQLLTTAPGDPQVHLAIANLQLDRGWTALATEKIELLLRLTSLTGDTQAEADVHGLASERLRDEPVSAATGR